MRHLKLFLCTVKEVKWPSEEKLDHLVFMLVENVGRYTES